MSRKQSSTEQKKIDQTRSEQSTSQVNRTEQNIAEQNRIEQESLRQIVITKLFALPHFIVSFSKPNQDARKEKFFKSMIASAIYIKPSAFHAYHIPITIAGLSTAINSLIPFKIYIITGDAILTAIFKAQFIASKNLPNISVSFFTRIPDLNEFYPNWRFDPKMLSDNVVWVFYLSTWSDIVGYFTEYNVLITGGVNAKRHILSPNQYKFVMLLNALGFHYKDIAYYYNSMDKDMIQTKVNFQNFLLQEKDTWSSNLLQAGNVLLEKSVYETAVLSSRSENIGVPSDQNLSAIPAPRSMGNVEENVNKEVQDYEKSVKADDLKE